MHKKRYLARMTALLLVAAMLTGCSLWDSSRPEVKGGAVGGATGAVAGALLEGWRGGIIGAAIGAVAGATITHIATQASREAAHSHKPVAYTNDAGTRRVEATPVASRGQCQTVVEKHYDNGQLVKEVQREVCD